jgi:hypothetical protein
MKDFHKLPSQTIGGSDEWLQKICDAHIAALAAASDAEDNRLEKMSTTIRFLEQQLAAERENARMLERALFDERNRH